jgi:hypothetical protein
LLYCKQEALYGGPPKMKINWKLCSITLLLLLFALLESYGSNDLRQAFGEVSFIAFMLCATCLVIKTALENI